MNYQIVLHDERKRFGLLPRITIFHEIIVFLVINSICYTIMGIKMAWKAIIVTVSNNCKRALIITTSEYCHKIMRYRFQTEIDNK